MAKRIMFVEGFDGHVELMTDRIIIHRPGIWNIFKFGVNSKREIPLMAISEVVIRQPLLLGMGSIEFVRSGRSQSEHTTLNYSLVKFKRPKQPEFEMLKEKIFTLLNELAQQQHSNHR